MKQFIILFSLTLLAVKANAQGIGSFFTQQADKVKIMLAQIADYEITLKDLKNGYTQTKNGLTTIYNLKDGSYNLHAVYFSSLSYVSASVKNNPKIAAISDLLSSIIKTFDQAIAWQSPKDLLSADEISNMKSVYSNLLSDCNKEMDELSLVITDGATQMKDEERIHAIDKLYTAMQSRYKFSCAFTAQAYALANNRAQDKADKQAIKKLYDLN